MKLQKEPNEPKHNPMISQTSIWHQTT